MFNLKDASAVSRITQRKDKVSFRTEASLGYITFSKCCWRLYSTLASDVSFPNGVSAVNFRGVPISSSASAPKKILSSKSPTVRTYSSYSLFTALLQRELLWAARIKLSRMTDTSQMKTDPAYSSGKWWLHFYCLCLSNIWSPYLIMNIHFSHSIYVGH